MLRNRPLLARPALFPALSALLCVTRRFPDDALFTAACMGDVDAIRARCAAGVAVNVRTVYGATALLLACDQGHIEVIRELLDA